MSKKILLIVEGENDEVKFVNQLFKVCSSKTEYKIYSYKSNIHIIAQELYKNYNDFDNDNIDICLVLASLESDIEKKKILMDKYTDVFLMFDFDPQHKRPHFDTVMRMLKYFSDSSSMGKLFINYPMMQSYKHFNILPSIDFENLIVNINNIKSYKSYVASISRYTNVEKYNYVIFVSITIHHLKKLFKILCDKYKIPSSDEYLNIDYLFVYKSQVDYLLNKKFVYVLNTSIFILIDFAPNKFFNYVNNHLDYLLI